VEGNIDQVSIDREERLAATDAGPGIILLTASMRLLYRDRRAWELCQQIIRGQDGKAANGVLPPAVAGLADQVKILLQARTDPKDWEQIQLRHVVNTLQSSVILCGTALIDQIKAETRILIVISEVGLGALQAQDKAIAQAKERFHLTARETTVVQHLLKGWTNKEIANEMRLAEQTIKEHFKRISEKTCTSTRTGIVMKIIHSGYALH
jgi:DNA-binding CsgD family transcriptional regulator